MAMDQWASFSVAWFWRERKIQDTFAPKVVRQIVNVKIGEPLSELQQESLGNIWHLFSNWLEFKDA